MMNPNLATRDRDIAPLENGDRLDRAEFERRYRAMPENCQAELIQGIVYMASPVNAKNHGRPHACIMAWLMLYDMLTPGVECLDNTTLRLDTDSEPQPDALLRIAASGRSTLDDRGNLEGAPELIVEIAASSASYDLHDKLDLYQRNQVREYIVWRTLDGEIDWFVWENGVYVKWDPDAQGLYRSRVFPGLWLDVEALLCQDLAKVADSVRNGCTTSEHRSFVEKLQP